MKKLVKNKNGFTLLEMLIVVAIAIIIIVAVMTSGILTLHGRAEKGSQKLSEKFSENANSYSIHEKSFEDYGF